MVQISLQGAWNNLVKGVGYSQPLVGLWNAANESVNAGLTYYERQVRQEQAKWGCNETETPVVLSPEVANSTPANFEPGGGAVGAALNEQYKQSICKHITQSNNYKLYEGFRALKGMLAAAPIVAGMAAFNFLGGSIAAILPPSFRGHFLNALSWLNNQVYFLLNFNLQMSDADLDKQSFRFIGLAGQTGEILGKSVGWMACGLSATAGVAVVNKARAAQIMAEVGKEGLEELTEELWALARMGQRQAQRAAFLQIFKNTRRWLKDPSNPFYHLLVAKFGKETIDQWGNPGNKPWTVNTAVEQWIESFNDVELQDFLESAYEGLIEGCQESFLCFAGSFSSDLIPPRRRSLNVDFRQLAALNAQ